MLYDRMWDYYETLPPEEIAGRDLYEWMDSLSNSELIVILSKILGDFS